MSWLSRARHRRSKRTHPDDYATSVVMDLTSAWGQLEPIGDALMLRSERRQIERKLLLGTPVDDALAESLVMNRTRELPISGPLFDEQRDRDEQMNALALEDALAYEDEWQLTHAR